MKKLPHLSLEFAASVVWHISSCYILFENSVMQQSLLKDKIIIIKILLLW